MRSSVFGETRGWKPLQTAGPAATTSQPLPQPYGHHRGQTDVCIPTHVQLLPAASPSRSAAQEVKILYKKSAAHLLSPTFLQKSPATISPSLLQTPPLQSIAPVGSRQLHTTKNPSTCPAPTGHLCLVPSSGSVSPPQPHVAAPAQEGHSLARLLPFSWGLFSFFFCCALLAPCSGITARFLRLGGNEPSRFLLSELV